MISCDKPYVQLFLCVKFSKSNTGMTTFIFMFWPHTFVSPTADSRGTVVSYWQKYVYEVLVNRLGGLSLRRKSVIRLTDCPDMTLDVYRGHKTTIQQQHFHGFF